MERCASQLQTSKEPSTKYVTMDCMPKWDSMRFLECCSRGCRVIFMAGPLRLSSQVSHPTCYLSMRLCLRVPYLALFYSLHSLWKTAIPPVCWWLYSILHLSNTLVRVLVSKPAQTGPLNRWGYGQLNVISPLHQQNARSCYYPESDSQLLLIRILDSPKWQ